MTINTKFDCISYSRERTNFKEKKSSYKKFRFRKCKGLTSKLMY